MKLRHVGLVVTGLFLLLSSAKAQDNTSLDAARKIRGDDQEGHRAVMHQRHAQDYVHTLYHYGNSEAGLKPSQAQTYIAEVKKNLQSSSKALQNLQAAHPDDPKVKSTIAKIESHHAKALKESDVVEAECQKSKTDNVKLSDCCVDIAHELTAAQKETDALLKHLKIDALPPLKKSTDKTAPKK